MTKLKIALLNNGYGVVHRGSERLTEEIYNNLKDEYDIDIWSIKNTHTKARKDIKIPWRNGRAYLESWYFGRYFYHHTYGKRYDIILNNAGFPCSYWCNKYRKKTGTPFITLERGGGREEKLNNCFKPNCMVYLTETSRNKYGKKGINNAVIPIGIDLKTYSKKLPVLDILKDLERPLILSTSALVGFKRINLIIDAVKKLGKGTLIQTSSGDMKDEICRYGKEKLGDRFSYLGVVPIETLIALYQQCDVFTSASKHEAFGIVYIEAMASGLPVVTQHDSRRKEIIGNAGRLVSDCEDTTDFASSLRNATKRDWKNIPQRRAKKFSWNVLKPKYMKVIDGVKL